MVKELFLFFLFMPLDFSFFSDSIQSKTFFREYFMALLKKLYKKRIVREKRVCNKLKGIPLKKSTSLFANISLIVGDLFFYRKITLKTFFREAISLSFCIWSAAFFAVLARSSIVRVCILMLSNKRGRLRCRN